MTNKRKEKISGSYPYVWKSIWLGTAPTYDKNTQQSGNRGSSPQHNKGHIWETYSQHHNQWTRTESFPTKIRKKTRISAFTTSILIVLGVLATVITHDKEIKSIQIGKEEVKLSLFAQDMLIYIENPIDPTKKLHDVLSAFGKTAGF